MEISDIPFIQQLYFSIPNAAGKNDASSWDFPFLPSFQNTHIFYHFF